MKNIIKSALYKLSKDWTFRITLIIGAALAIIMNLIYLGLGFAMGKGGAYNTFCNGQSMYISSLSPTQNFGLAVPINLIIFTIGEFNCGTIRNKIIAGHKRSSIYLSLFIIGLIFTISLIFIYFGISVALGSIIGGFNVNGNTLNGVFRPEYLYQYPLMGLCVYIFITALAICISVMTRNIGASMPIVIVTLLVLYFVSLAPIITALTQESKSLESIQMWFNPMYTFGVFSTTSAVISNKWFIASLITPLYWSVIFTFIGLKVFKRSDVK